MPPNIPPNSPALQEGIIRTPKDDAPSPAIAPQCEPPEDRKWPTRERRQEVFSALCAHIGAGFSLESFPDADRKTIRYYAEQFPEDFPREKLEEAARRGLLEWEKIGKDGVRGDLAKFNASAWAFNMKNRAGWRDRAEVEAWSVLSSPEEMSRIEKFKPRSAEEIALGVMALLTRERSRKTEECGQATDGS